ncbi:trypsin-like serine protease [Amycolatopsis sp. FDAARGOS 1241]|uniref:S1 family peptidase n=1 Tax=Amycolatopsis sp. FDAARGOS 1241 TaxID=2778070 RepID=UPI0019517F51|nr:serine protease [Amycolatopsis sp. FDAARGOS 1241]QRP47210.1 serine protease [Amycolatopsis sp. FDAARGOS 1241]
MPKRSLALLLTIFATAALATGIATAGPVIVGGTDADEPYPFAVSLHTASGALFCAGALISPTWVVTAAHCVSGKDPATLAFRLGTNDSDSGGETAQPKEIVLNPHFNSSTQTGDIALVRLPAPAKAAPIALGAAAAPGTATRVLGWGQTCPTPGCGDPSKSLQQLDTQLVEGSRCTANFDGTAELCTDNPHGTAGSCYGDSGSPELTRDGDHWTLIGLTSRPGNASPTCATAPSIYTSVVAYAPWITSKTG